MINFYNKVTFDEGLKKLLQEVSITRIYQKNDIITNAGSVEKFLSVIKKGHTAQFYVGPEGKEICYDLQFEGDYVTSFSSFITREPSLFEIRAIEPTELQSVEFEKLKPIYDEMKYQFDKSFLQLTDALYIYTKRRLVNLYHLNAEERYLDLIEKVPNVIERTPAKHIASFLGLTPETLSRLVSKLKRE